MLPHLIIHAAVLALLIKNPFVVGVIVATHFVIDWVKVALDDGSRQGISFLMDQSVHLMVLLLVARYGGVLSPKLALDFMPFILALSLMSAFFMFLNVVKDQIVTAPVPKVVCRYAFHVSKVAGWSAVLSLLLSVLFLH